MRTPFPFIGPRSSDVVVVGAVVVMVSVLVAGVLVGVIEEGAKLHCAPEGNPAQRKVMA